MTAVVADVVSAVLPAAASAPRETPLVDLGLDSLGVLRIVRALERECGIVIPGESITSDHFASIASVDALVSSLR